MKWSIFVLAYCIILTKGSEIPKKTSDQNNFLIIGGTNATINSYPFMVQLEARPDANGSYSLTCGGSIISSKAILTAAHCSAGLPPNYRVRAGTTNLAKGGKYYYVAQIITHPLFSNKSGDQINDYDIGIFLLNATIIFSTTINSIPIITTNCEPTAGTSLTIAGWEVTQTGNFSQVLQVATVLYVNRTTCNLNYFGNDGLILVTERMLCAAAPEKDR